MRKTKGQPDDGLTLLDKYGFAFTTDMMPQAQIKALKVGQALDRQEGEKDIDVEDAADRHYLKMDWTLMGETYAKEFLEQDNKNREWKRMMMGRRVDPGNNPEAFEVKSEEWRNPVDTMTQEILMTDFNPAEIEALAQESFMQNTFQFTGRGVRPPYAGGTDAQKATLAKLKGVNDKIVGVNDKAQQQELMSGTIGKLLKTAGKGVAVSAAGAAGLIGGWGALRTIVATLGVAMVSAFGDTMFGAQIKRLINNSINDIWGPPQERQALVTLAQMANYKNHYGNIPGLNKDGTVQTEPPIINSAPIPPTGGPGGGSSTTGGGF